MPPFHHATHFPPLSLLGSAEPLSPVPHRLSATDTFPGDTQIRLQLQPAEGWCFSDAEGGVSSDDSTPGLFTPPASVGGARPTPARAIATAAGRPSAFFTHTHCDPAPAAGSHRRVRAGKDLPRNVSKIMAYWLSCGVRCDRTRRMRRFEGRSRNPPTRTTGRPISVVAWQLPKNRAAATDVKDGKSNDTTTLWGNGVQL